jgi:rubrerythrin
MGFQSFEEIIRFAIGKEEEAIAFYQEISMLEPYPGTKKTFEGFAGEEAKHKVMLEEVLSGKKQPAEYDFKWIPDLKRSDYMVDLEYEKGMPWTDILRLAMKREEKALRLYNELQAKAEKEDFTEVFKMLAQEEAKHKLALETLYDDYMAEQGD